LKSFLILLCSLSSLYSSSQEGFSVSISSGCSPLIVNFTYTAGGNPTNLSWNFGNSTTLNGDPVVDPILLNPSIPYISPGSYTVTLIATTSSGTITYSSSNLITVFEDPQPNFIADVLLGCGAFPVTFTDLSNSTDGAIIQWNWDFGDAGSSTQQYPTHIYDTPGIYDVSLIVTDENGCNGIFSIENYITATDGVYPNFSVTNQNSCELPTIVSINNLSTGTGSLSYNWSFGNSSTSTLENPPAVNYSNYGVYNIVLNLSNDLGCSQSFYQTITIQEFSADFEVESPCLPFATSFINTSSDAMNTFLWDFGDPGSGFANNSSLETPQHLYSESGNYTVTLTASIDGECEVTYSSIIQVIEGEDISYSLDISFTCSLPTSVPIAINNANVESFNWSVTHINDGPFASGDELDPIIFFGENMNVHESGYNLNLVVQFENGCVSYLEVEDFISLDTLSVSAIILPDKLCVGETAFGSDQTTDPSGISNYFWDWGNGIYGYSANSSRTFDNAGDYPVSLTITTNDGCIATKDFIIQVGIKTNPSFTYEEATICIEDSILFTYTGDPSIVDEYIWNLEGISTHGGPSEYLILYEVDSLHYITLVTENNGCKDTIQQEVTINVLGPKALINLSPDFFCKEEAPYISNISNTSISTENTVYQWAFSDSYLDSTVVENPGEYEFFEPGTHYVILNARDTITGCETEAIDQVFIDNFHITFFNEAIDGCDYLNYSNYMVPVESPFLYTWDFGDGFIGYTQGITDPIITHTYNETGSFLIQTSTINNFGCPDTAFQWNQIHPSPIASFSIESQFICPPSILEVQNTSIEMDTIITSFEYILSNNDSVYFLEENPSIYIELAEPYFLTQIVTDGFGCFDSTTLELSPHEIEFDYSIPDFLCYNTEYIIANDFFSEFPPVSFLWEFGNGMTSTAINPLIIIDDYQDEDFINYVSITDGTGCTRIDSFYIHMSLQSFNYSFLFDDATCPPIYCDFGIFSNESITSFAIDYGDGESNSVNTPEDALNMSHVYDFPGYYNVNFSVTDSNGCTTTQYSDSLVFVPGPWATFSFSPNNGCPPLEVIFEIIEENNVDEYFWLFGDGYSSELSNPIHTYNLAGTYSPILLIQDPVDYSSGDSLTCIVTISGEDLIIEGPILNFFVLNDTLCFGSTNNLMITNLTEDQPGFVISSYLWDFGDGTLSSDENPPTHSYDEPGLYTISLTVNTTNGCVYMLEKEGAVYVMPPPELSPYALYTPVCPPMDVYFYGDSTTGFDPNIEFYWEFGDGQNSNEVFPIHNYINDAIYYPSLEVSMYGCTFSSSFENMVSSLPVPEAIINAFPVFTDNVVSQIELQNQSIDEDYIEWYVNGVFNSIENTISINAQFEDLNVYLIALNEFECADTTWFSLNDFNWELPNIITPNHDGINEYFVLNFNGFGPCISLQIFNRWGLKIYESSNYQNNWNGRDENGDKVSDGTYYYILNVCNKANIAGYITVLH